MNRTVAGKPKCENCKFFIGWPQSIYGKCVRYPPVGMRQEAPKSTAWPDVKIGEWCGEFKAIRRAPR